MQTDTFCGKIVEVNNTSVIMDIIDMENEEYLGKLTFLIGPFKNHIPLNPDHLVFVAITVEPGKYEAIFESLPENLIQKFTDLFNALDNREGVEDVEVGNAI